MIRTALLVAGHVGLVLAVLLSSGVAGAGDKGPAALGRYGIDADKVSVSGLSSGGYMAVQLDVAYSSVFRGVGVFAAGPYGCADTGGSVSANVNRALGPCMAGAYSFLQRWQCLFWLASCPGSNGPDADASIKLAHTKADQHAIDPLSNLARHRIFLVSGKKDKTVDPTVVDALDRFYSAFVPRSNIKHERLDMAAHTFPTDTFSKGNKCGLSDPPYVSDCKYDGAKHLLSHLYGALNARNDGAPKGSLLEFDQTTFWPQGRDTAMAVTGYIYVPNTCSEKAPSRCAMHVALHGCKQTVSDVNKDFVEGAGYNRWADTNSIIVLYPQIAKKLISDNPDRCWDWWGYTGAEWNDKGSAQMRAIIAMLDQLKSSAH